MPKKRTRRKKVSVVTVIVFFCVLTFALWFCSLIFVARNKHRIERRRRSNKEDALSGQSLVIEEKKEKTVIQPIVAINSYEKPVSSSVWLSDAWRASSEPGGYMQGPSLKPIRLPRLEKNFEAYTSTQLRDSFSVEPISLMNCTSVRQPQLYYISDILENWPPDLITVPPRHFGSLCRFDYQSSSQRELAKQFRDAEIPFLIYNEPRAKEISRKFSTKEFLAKRLGTKRYRTERSDDNHFMYYMEGGRSLLRGSNPKKNWQPPTTNVLMTYTEWLEHARMAYNLSVLDPHFYFRVSSPDLTPADLPVFLPPKRGDESLFLKDPKAMKGVHCRFGAAGIIAEAHYDGSRNFVGEFGGPPDHPNAGRRRYILAPPAECKHAYLLPRGHPSGRHSQIDWSRPVDLDRFPSFKQLRALEVIIEPGDLLYIPHGWIHYIISLGTNFQCNARSGRNSIGADDLRDCGFAA
mmetsp:Transcript_19043/g.28783  ORF Transcript_19043/g.28783 Transcript_19043/m.28783 type:complete len:464 (-) Transcript_19043:1786-3177(-)